MSMYMLHAILRPITNNITNIFMNAHLCLSLALPLSLSAWCLSTLPRLEPMLSRIKEDRQAVLCPTIDSIVSGNMGQKAKSGNAVGGFSWGLHFSWRGVPQRENDRRKSPADPIRFN